MDTLKRRIIMKVFINSQSRYCPLVWMCHRRNINNRTQEKLLGYIDHICTFEELLKRDGSVTIHIIRNIQLLAIEVYKVVNGISLETMNEIFQLKEWPKYITRYTMLGLYPMELKPYRPSVCKYGHWYQNTEGSDFINRI